MKTMTRHWTHDRPATSLPRPRGNRWDGDTRRFPVDPQASVRGLNGTPTVDASVVLQSTVGKTATYRRSDVLFVQGDVADSVLFIRDGIVKLSVLSRGGKEGIVALLESGHFLGESALADRPTRLQTATALTTTTIQIIPTAQMIRALHTDHAFSDRFTAHMLARNTRLEGDLVDLLLNPCERRLARALLLLSRDDKPRRASRALPRISQAVLADMIGTTRSRVNFFMNTFKRRGFIEEDGGLKINDSLVTVLLQDDTVDVPAAASRMNRDRAGAWQLREATASQRMSERH